MPDIPKKLTSRSASILQLLVELHIESKQPISSGCIAHRLEQKWSSATIRNEMTALTKAGFLFQPHTSAGRVPTLKAMRYFVDTFTPSSNRSLEKLWSSTYIPMSGDPQKLARHMSTLLSDYARLPGLAIQPGGASYNLNKLEFVYLESGKLLAILITDSGSIYHHSINVKKTTSARDLERFNHYLNGKMQGLSLSQMRRVITAELEQDRVRVDRMLCSALELCSRVLEKSDETDVYFEGQATLLQTQAFKTVDKVRPILAAMSRKDRWLALLDRTYDAPGVQVHLGRESEIAGMEDCAIVIGSYGTPKKGRGGLGIIGPVNLDYSQIVPMVDYAVQTLNRQIQNTQE